MARLMIEMKIGQVIYFGKKPSTEFEIYIEFEFQFIVQLENHFFLPRKNYINFKNYFQHPLKKSKQEILSFGSIRKLLCRNNCNSSER